MPSRAGCRTPSCRTGRRHHPDILTVLIRDFGSYPEGMSFAILIMNGFTPLINTYVKPKRFGEVKK